MQTFEDILKKAFEEAGREVVFAVDEKAALRERLVAYMEHKPLRKDVRSEEAVQHVGFGSRLLAFFGGEHVLGAALIAVLVVTGTFGVSRAADDALPGDFLYPVKVDVNEKVYAALLSGDQELLAWERELAERRLMEASRLAAEGRLDGELKDEILKRFAEQSDALVAHVYAVEPENPLLALEQSSEFEAALDNHEAVLARLIVEREDAQADEARDVVERVRTMAQRASEAAEAVEERLAVGDPAPSEELVTVSALEQAPTTSTSDEAAPEGRTPSANVRDRAAYEAKTRAQHRLADAERELARLSGDDALRADALAQVEKGRERMKEGDEAIERSDLSVAYRSYKEAGVVFQKVSQLLSMATLFNVRIRVGNEAADENNPMLGALSVAEQHAQVEKALLDTRSRLLASSFDERTLERAHAELKEASAYLLRGDIARSLGQEDDARNLYATAARLDERIRLLLGTDDAREGSDTSAKPPVPPTAGPTTPTAPPAPPELPALDTVTVYHEYENGTHTYSGVYYTPTPCFALSAEAQVAESMPEQVTLVLTAKDQGGACAMMIDRKAFSVEVKASAEAKFIGVRVNDTISKYKLVEGPNTEIFEEAPTVPVTRTPAEAEDTAPSFVARALQATSDFLRP